MKERQRRDFLKVVGASAVLPGFLTGRKEAAEPVRNRIKVGQIGVGHAHASKLSVYRASADYELVGIVEPDSALRKRAAGQEVYRRLPWLTQEQLLNTAGLQAILVETRVGDLLRTAGMRERR